MIVNIKYCREDGNPFGRAYSYRTKLALGTGARVLCPTSSGMRTGVVVEINVPESAVDPDVLPLLREITKMAPAPRPEPKPVLVKADPDWDAGGTVTVEQATGSREQATEDEENEGRPQAAPTGETEGEAAPEPEVPEIEGLVRVAQLPVIVERLRQMKDYVEGMTEEAMALACTEDTVQTVKQRRADLNRFFNELEAKRKAVKAAVMGPYTAFEAVYKECICNPFNDADAALKAKIDAVEREQKQRCEDYLRKWFSELTLTHNVSWLTFEQTGIKIDMASAKAKTPQKLMDRLNEFAAKVALDQETISRMEDAAEVMAEYKKTLSLSQAINTVSARKEAVERERQAERERREAAKARLEAEARVEAAAPEVLAPPVVQATGNREQAAGDSKVYKCSFTVKATKEQLKKLKNFLIEEGISYE